MTSPDNQRYQDTYRGQVITLNRLTDGTRTIEVALNDPSPVGTLFTLGTVVEVHVFGHVYRSAQTHLDL